MGCLLPNATLLEAGRLRGTIVKRGGKFGIKVDLPKAADGKRKQKWLGTYPSRKDAEDALARVLGEVVGGTYVPPTKQTFQEFAERWLRDYAMPRLRPTTYKSYEWLLKNHVLPSFGLRSLSRLTPADLQQLYREKLGSGLSPRTVQYIHAVLHKMLDSALKWGLVGRNVADAAEAPVPQRKEMKVLDPDEARQLIEAAGEEGAQTYAIIAVALLTGMRRGEIFGLRWQDVDLDAAALQVRQALVEAGGRRVFSQPKSGAGARRIDLPGGAVDALRKHRAAQAQDKLLLGPDYADHGLVFAQWNGKPLHPHNFITRTYPRLLEKAGLQRIRFHDLRHTHATLMLARDVHPKIVQERLGHSSITVTMNTYTHVLPGLQREAARKVEELIAPKSKGEGRKR